jgi:anti-sigma B factor antagonist
MSSVEFRSENLDDKSTNVIVVDGDLDAYSAPRLREMLAELIATGSDWIVVDCGSVDYIDSSGLGALVSGLKQISDRNGGLALARPNDSVRRVLQITGLDRLFPVYRGVDEAREAGLLQNA